MGPKKLSYNSKIKYNTNAIFLLIVESPSKCSKIESFLGNNYACIASMGHLQTINSLKDIDTKNNYNPTFKIIDDKKSYISQMTKIISNFDKDNIIIATDDDREGEAIGWHICNLFSLDIKKTKRIIFHEITKNAIQEAIKNPTTIDMNIVSAQFSRQILDIIVGFKISPFLWKYLYNNKENSLSAGRCQTPALRLVYDLYKQNNDNIEIKYKTTGYFTDHSLLFTLNANINGENIVDFLEKSKKFNYSLKVGEQKQSSISPSKPFNTSRLLQVVGNTLNLSPKQIMNICQKLYQAGYITYMRTESTKYSNVFIKHASDNIISKYGEKYIGDIKKITNTDINNPHEAVRVTNLNNLTATDTKDQFLSKVYKIIYNNTIESCMSNYTANVSIISINSPINNVYYEHKNEIPVFYGWKIVKNSYSIDEVNKQAGMLLYFKSLYNNSVPIDYKIIDCNVSIKTNINHYSEHSLINKLESLGIGRPSTFATIVDVIQERKYVEKKDIEAREIFIKEYSLDNNRIINSREIKKKYGEEKNKLVITNIGIITLEFLINNFDSIFSYNYTELMERELDNIASGTNKEWYSLCNNCDYEIKDISKKIKDVQKCNFKLNEEYDIVFERYGPSLRTVDNDGNFIYKNIRKDIEIDINKIQNNNYLIEDIIEDKDDLFLGKHNDKDIFKKIGKYGPYIEYDGKTKSIKDIKKKFSDIKLEDVLGLINNDDKEVSNIFREFTPYLSVRKGKYGAYAYFKKTEMRKPTFYNIKKFKGNFIDCDKDIFINWICDNYNRIPEDFV